MWVAGQPQAATLAGKRAHGRVVRWGQHPHASTHLHALRALLVPTAAGPCGLRSGSVHGEFHLEAVVHTPLLERPTVANAYFLALQHAAHAYGQQLNAACALRCATKQARLHSGTRHTFVTLIGEDEGHIEAIGAAAVSQNRPTNQFAQLRRGGVLDVNGPQRRISMQNSSPLGVVSRTWPT